MDGFVSCVALPGVSSPGGVSGCCFGGAGVGLLFFVSGLRGGGIFLFFAMSCGVGRFGNFLKVAKSECDNYKQAIITFNSLPFLHHLARGIFTMLMQPV